MKTFLKVLGGVAALLVVIIAFNWPSDAKMEALSKEERVNQACDQMMSDSALGNERRMTRDICDRLKAEAKRKVKETP